MWWDKWIAKDLEGTSHNLIELHSQNFPEETEENHEKYVEMGGAPTEIKLSMSWIQV
jgi:hypothetical protein